jgi:hypothetical protein
MSLKKVQKMANLKGGSFEKQVKDIHHRTSAFNESRHGKNDHQTHSSALSEKRGEMARSFANFCENKSLDGKLNEHMTNENIKEFLEQRTQDLALSTSENYARSFGSMIEGLKESNVDIQADKSVINDYVKDLKDNSTPMQIESGRAIENVENVISNIYNDRYESGVIADVQHELGLRVSEAHELVSNPDKYINDDKVEHLIGKGNHEYDTKEISQELQAKIEQCQEIPSVRTYQEDLAKQEITSHEFRYTYAKEHEHDMTKEELSKELNHNREEMTNYYLARA